MTDHERIAKLEKRVDDLQGFLGSVVALAAVAILALAALCSWLYTG